MFDKLLMTTFVSCIFLENSEFSHIESLLDRWERIQVNVQFYVKYFDVLEKLNTRITITPSSSIRFVPLQDLRCETWASKIDLQRCPLPERRNDHKDTLIHIWNTLHKIPCMSHCVRENPYQTPFFFYLDFDVFELFREPATETYLREHYGHTQRRGHKSLFFPNQSDVLYIPGCWDKLDRSFVKSPEYKHNIHWRFCGASVFGSARSVLHFDQYYTQYFETYVLQNDMCLSWEVNYWAWLEATFESSVVGIQWIPGDHNDTLVELPNVFGYHVLKEAAEQYMEHEYVYPDLSPYRPMSASVVCQDGQWWLNTRYVNYWIYDNGAYWYPDDESRIRTKNLCTRLEGHHKKLFPVTFQEIKEDFQPPVVKRANVFSEGVEDIRLYVSQKTNQLMFIGSTLNYSYTDKIRMIVGEYHPEGTLTNARVVTSPNNNWCEKNWCPIPLNIGGVEGVEGVGNNGTVMEDGFVYQWHPLQIGRLRENTDPPIGTYALEMVYNWPTPHRLFGKIKGSTRFRKQDANWIGMVHYSEEMYPRQYYHRLVELCGETYKVLRCTESFCFEQPGVEFCMGMEILNGGMVAWISRKDRDPMMVEVEMSFFDDKWIGVDCV